jgi:hypothetical protein
MEQQDQRDHKAQQVQREIRVIPVQMVLTERQVHKDQRVRQVVTVLMVQMV